MRHALIGATALLLAAAAAPAGANPANAACDNWLADGRPAAPAYATTAGGVHPPLTCFRVTSPFGARRDPFSGRTAQHDGIDLGAPEGSPVFAIAAGVVVEAHRDDGSGNLVAVRHADGSVSRYAHMKLRYVRIGEAVAAGAPVGLVGSKGRATGPHLHLEVHHDGRPVDPLPLIAPADGIPAAEAPVAPPGTARPAPPPPVAPELDRERIRRLLARTRGQAGIDV